MTNRDERLRARGPATHAAAADGASKARTDEAHNALVANRTRDVVAAAAGRLRFPRVQGFTISPFVSKLSREVEDREGGREPAGFQCEPASGGCKVSQARS